MAGASGSVGDLTETGAAQQPSADVVLETHTHGDVQRPMADGEEPRRSRSRGRDRGRDRDRGDRAPREEASGNQQAGEFQPAAEPARDGASEVPAERQRYATGFADQNSVPESAAPGEADAVRSEPFRSEPLAAAAPRELRGVGPRSF